MRINRRAYEAITARLQRRLLCNLYHSGLEVVVPEGRHVIEMTPVIDANGHEHGVVAEGPVGARWAGRLRMFRYELRRWRDGAIPDISEAVESPRRLSSDLGDARRLLELVPQVPMLVWGRDDLRTGEMWNSNSMMSWLIARIGLDADSVKPPAGGRAPGWNAGVVVAARQSALAPRLALRPILDGPIEHTGIRAIRAYWSPTRGIGLRELSSRSGVCHRADDGVPPRLEFDHPLVTYKPKQSAAKRLLLTVSKPSGAVDHTEAVGYE